MGNVIIHKKPIYVEFDRRREVVFDLNTEILIRNAGGKDGSIWEEVGKRENPKTGAVERLMDVNLDNLRLYLWAALQADCKARGEFLTVEEAGALLRRRKWVLPAVDAITEALDQYYGEDPGEEPAPAGSV